MATDLVVLAIATKSILRDVAKHANGLAVGLQNAAPPQDSKPNRSVLYLAEIAAKLEELSHSIEES
jgi:hypothetical protein